MRPDQLASEREHVNPAEAQHRHSRVIRHGQCPRRVLELAQPPRPCCPTWDPQAPGIDRSRPQAQSDQQVRLYPFQAEWSATRKPIVIDPRISFGQPTVAGSGVSTGALVQRIDAGETVEALSWDYGLEIAQIEGAILYERA